MGLPESIDPVVVLVSRAEVEANDISSPLNALRTLTQSVATAREFCERVDIAFHGYDQDSRELFEIPEVRNFVHRLDEQFPFWLFFYPNAISDYNACCFAFSLRTLRNRHAKTSFPSVLTIYFPIVGFPQ
jgi:hypothetical protein